MGRYGAGTRNKEGSMVVDFGKRLDLAIVNTYFKKKEEHRVTYKSGGKSTQVDYVMCRRRNLKEICDCKVILNECVAKQHRMVVCKMALPRKHRVIGRILFQYSTVSVVSVSEKDKQTLLDQYWFRIVFLYKLV